MGTSKHYTTMEVYSGAGTSPGTSPIVDILDDNNLGRIKVSIFQNTAAIRKYNGNPYLDRNYAFLPENDATGKQISMILYFTTAEFNAIKAADFSIADPGYLSVIRQPSISGTAAATYTPVAGEEIITPKSWDSVDGGYYVKFIAAGTGNFFIRKMTTTSLCPSSTTAITSDINGATYQWFANTGSMLVSIANDANYSGVNTAILTLTNIPSSFNGYRYLCLVDGTNFSSSVYLQVANIWTGTVSNPWENAANWSCGTIPDANTDVFINSGTVTINSNASCRSLKINPGAGVVVSPGFNLSVSN